MATKDGKPLNTNGSNSITGEVYGHVQINANGHTAQLVIFRRAGYVPKIPTSAGYNPSNPGATFRHIGRKVLEPNVADHCRRGWTKDSDHKLELGKLPQRTARHTEPVFYLLEQWQLQPEPAL